MRRHSPLRALLKGLVSGSLAMAVAGAIELGVRAHLRHGNHQIAADSLGMLWVPAVFALVALLFVGQALFQSLALLGAALPGLRRRTQAPPQRRPVRPPKRCDIAALPLPRQVPDPYRQACAQLGVPPGSAWEVIRAAWRRNLPHWHPDRGGDPELWHIRLAAYRLLEASEGLKCVPLRPLGADARRAA